MSYTPTQIIQRAAFYLNKPELYGVDKALQLPLVGEAARAVQQEIHSASHEGWETLEAVMTYPANSRYIDLPDKLGAMEYYWKQNLIADSGLSNFVLVQNSSLYSIGQTILISSSTTETETRVITAIPNIIKISFSLGLSYDHKMINGAYVTLDAISSYGTIMDIVDFALVQQFAFPSTSNQKSKLEYYDPAIRGSRVQQWDMTFQYGSSSVFSGSYKYYQHSSKIYLDPTPSSLLYLYIQWTYNLPDPTSLSQDYWSPSGWWDEYVDLVALELAIRVAAKSSQDSRGLTALYERNKDKMLERSSRSKNQPRTIHDYAKRY